MSLAPEAGDATTTFTCSASGSVDPDAGDSVTYLVAWYVDDAVVAGVTTGSATGAELGASHGDAIACGVKASDGAASSAEVRSDARTLGNATPTLDNVFITAAHMPPTKADTLACEPQDGADPDDGDTLTYSYTWTRNGAVIAGATGATLAGEAFAKGDRIGCTAQGCDAGGACTPVVSSKTIMTIGNALPFVTGVAMTEVAAHGEADGNAQPGDVLTCEYATATDLDQGDAIEIIYGFYEVKADGTVVELYSGSDASYAVPETLTPGSTLYCTVTPTNPPDPGPRGESQSFDVVEPTPIPPVVAVSAPNGADGDVTCEITTPAQWFGSGATTTWYWTVNGGAETEGAQVLANADVDGCDLVKCRVVVANAATSLSSNTASKSLPLGSTGCDDGNACTQATCKAAGGCNFIVTPGALCDDGDACSPSSACDSEGACVAQSDICVEDALDVTTEVQHWPTVAALPSGGYLARFGAATPRYRLTDANDTRVQEEKALTTGADAQFRTRPAVGANGKALVTTWSFSWANSNHQNYFSALVVDTATGELGANYHLHTRGMWGGGAYYEPIAPDSVALPYSDGSWGVFLNDTYTSAFYVIGAPPQPGQHYIQYWTISADGVASAATTLFGEANVARRAYPTDARLIPDGSDRFVAAWLMGDERTITARLYTKSGTEVLPQPITVTTAAEGSAIDTVRVLGLRNGAFWVAWSESLGDADGYGVKIQRFTASGAPNGAPFVATADEIGQQHLGDLAAFSDYGVVLVYDDSLIDGAGAGVAAQLITSGGVLDGGAVQLNGYAAGDQVEASVATLPGDEMVVTWRDGANRLWTRRFDRTVARFGTAFEIPANDGTFGAQRAPAVATLITGETLVAWDSDVFGDPDLMARVFDADGNAQSADLPVSTYGTGAQISAVAAGGTSRFVVAWDSQEQNGGVDGIVARWLDADGEAVSDEVVVTTAVGAQRDPAVAMTWGDDALVAWTADMVSGTSITDVKVRPYDLDGEAMGPEVVVNATTAQAQAQPAV
ncbi:MAG: hypothetical protein KC635_00765, partial [Myxococcales bacterium]|nr:hypothetical protein [Myxococcales bacterium]